MGAAVSRTDLDPSPSAGDLPPLTPFEVVRWARAGASDPDTVHRLRAEGVLPSEAERRLCLADGTPSTVVTAVELGQLPAAEVPFVAATWPGQGWAYEPGRGAWSLSLPPSVLAGLARSSTWHGRSPGLDAGELGAQMALEMARRSPAATGAELELRAGVEGILPPPGWTEGLEEAMIRESALAALEALRTQPHVDAAWRRAWLAGAAARGVWESIDETTEEAVRAG